jgi:hypothetical protein
MTAESNSQWPMGLKGHQAAGAESSDPVAVTEVDDRIASSSKSEEGPEKPQANLKWKLTAVLFVSLIGFGGHWSSGITGAMKSTLKKQLKINNTQFALLEASEDFMVTLLILFSGVVTDRIGGAGEPMDAWGFW